MKFVMTIVAMSALAAMPARAQVRPQNSAESNALTEVRARLATGLISVQPWIQMLDSNRIGVGWMTSSPADGIVEWTQDAAGADSNAWRQAWFSEDGLRTANGTTQKAVVEGFDPSKPLRLRARSRPITSFGAYKVTFGEPVFSAELTLPPQQRAGGKVSFVVFNDIHSRTFLYPMLLPLAGSPVDFVILNGDVLQDPANAPAVRDYLLLPMSWFASRSIPCFFLRGNHETRGAAARELRDYLMLPDNRYYGALTVGAARLLLLDCGEDKPDEHWAYSGLVDFTAYMREQARWLETELSCKAFNDAVWRIAVIHIPPDWRTDGQAGRFGEKRINSLLAPLLDRGRINVVISGHNHKPELIDPPRPDLKEGFQWPVFIGGAHPFEGSTVTRVEADLQTLCVRMIGSDGKVTQERTWRR